jgi:hypothetical protein
MAISQGDGGAAASLTAISAAIADAGVRPAATMRKKAGFLVVSPFSPLGRLAPGPNQIF